MIVRTGSKEVEGPDTSRLLQLEKLAKGTLLTSGAGTRHASGSRRLEGYHIETTDMGPCGSLSLALDSVPAAVAAWFGDLLDEKPLTVQFQLQEITYHEGETKHWALAAFDPASDVCYALPTFVFGALTKVEKRREFLISPPVAE